MTQTHWENNWFDFAGDLVNLDSDEKGSIHFKREWFELVFCLKIINWDIVIAILTANDNNDGSDSSAVDDHNCDVRANDDDDDDDDARINNKITVTINGFVCCCLFR